MKVYNKSVRNRLVFAALFAAMIAVSNFFQIPTPIGVPIVLKNMFVVLSGTVLGSFYGGIAALILIAAGLIGIPVFVIPGGIGVFNTLLGGYIIGYFFSCLFAGLICGLPKITEKKIRLLPFIRVCIASFLGFALILLCGSLYMMFLRSMTLKAAFLAGTAPFIIGDLIKAAISIPLALTLRPIAAKYINNK
ncbi:MAG: biotin transporter BioY [Treponema sp.]|jgi:biotin transport system substrate-specific component|nr:biotin transporter BioY [Treponema sp.]